MDEFQVAPPEIPAHIFRLTDYGAVGDGKTINTAAFAKAIAAVSAAGGGQLIVPKGEFLTGPITLASHLELHLEAGAKIQFPTDWATYGRAPSRARMPPLLPAPCASSGCRSPPRAVRAADAGPRRRTVRENFLGLVYGNNLTDIAITGSGTIDGGGQLFYGAISSRSAKPPRPAAPLAERQPSPPRQASSPRPARPPLSRVPRPR